MAKKILLDEYQQLGDGEFDLQPYEVFKVEGQLFMSQNDSILGSGLMIFTGLVIKDHNSGSDLLHCVPLLFYGNSSEKLSAMYIGCDLWIEISVEEESGYSFPQELLN